MTLPRTPLDPELDLGGIRLQLDIAEAARTRQLAALPAVPPDAVARLHRESVERLLDRVRAARRRLDDGSYGACLGCEEPIPVHQLELWPWTETCKRCLHR